MSTKYTDALREALRLMEMVIDQKPGAEPHIQDWGLLPEDEDDLWETLEAMMVKVYSETTFRAAILAVFILGVQVSYEGYLKPPYHLDRLN